MAVYGEGCGNDCWGKDRLPRGLKSAVEVPLYGETVRIPVFSANWGRSCGRSLCPLVKRRAFGMTPPRGSAKRCGINVISLPGNCTGKLRPPGLSSARCGGEAREVLLRDWRRHDLLQPGIVTHPAELFVF